MAIYFTILISLGMAMFGFSHKGEGSSFSFREATVHDIRIALEQNKLTSRQLVEFYLGEIQRLNPILKGVIEVNPDALYLADKADQERKAKKPCSTTGLAGIPILLKDNIASKDKLNTTAGSYALLGSVVPQDAAVVKKLRNAGAIILGKASMTEWAAYRSNNVPNGWNARRGQSVGRPICRTVSDAVYVLDAIVGFDPDEPLATKKASKYIPHGGYLQFLKSNGLRGKRLGITRYSFVGFDNSSKDFKDFEPHFNILRQRGAVLVDIVDTANFDTIVSKMYNDQFTAMNVEFKLALNAYLKQLVTSPVRSLADAIVFNKEHSKLEKIEEYGQDIFEAAEKTNGIGRMERELLLNLTRASKNGFEKLMKDNKLDALVTPYYNIIYALSAGGYPGINVPAGYDIDGIPYGISFGGVKGSEPKLIEIAYDFEQATKIRKPPPL